MKCSRLIIGLLTALACLISLPAKTMAAGPELYIREVNITGNEFLVLQAGTDIADVSQYWLGYVNSDNSLAVPSQKLPAISLLGGQALLLSSSPSAVCDASFIDQLSFSGFNNAKGSLALWRQAGTSFNQIENVSWGPATDSPNIIIATENYITPSPASAVWYNDGSESWIVGDLQNCALTNAVDQTSTHALQADVSWTTGAVPPAIIVSLASGGETSAGLPATDIGLAGPEITELLPNPASPGSDASDEFIELYNPNNSSFDLGGFSLEIGSTTKHDYTFPAGTSLPGQSWKAFYSSDTHLSLSNSGGQVWLIDPSGKIVSQADAYSKAKDGLAWALAGDSWYWTSTPTPGAVNLINGAPAAQAASKTKTTPLVSAASTSASPRTSTSANSPAAQPAGSVHPAVLALVGAAALLYAGYEYRTDLANRISQFRRYLESRKEAGR